MLWKDHNYTLTIYELAAEKGGFDAVLRDLPTYRDYVVFVLGHPAIKCYLSASSISLHLHLACICTFQPTTPTTRRSWRSAVELRDCQGTHCASLQE
jgi:hypothetical protein